MLLPQRKNYYSEHISLAADFCGRFLRYACARNAHLRRANSAFSRCASLELASHKSPAGIRVERLTSNVDSPKVYRAYKAYKAYGAYGRNGSTERYGINPQPSPSPKLGELSRRDRRGLSVLPRLPQAGGWHLPILFFLFFLSFLFFLQERQE